MHCSKDLFLFAASIGLTIGCGSDQSKCDPGQVLKNAICVPDDSKGGAANGGDSAKGASGASQETAGGVTSASESGNPGAAGDYGLSLVSTAGSGDGSGGTGADTSNTVAAGGIPGTVQAADLFGISCSADPDCTAPADYCAKMPGASTGYCTQEGCKTDATICPASWTCFDLSAIVPNGPNFCQEPT